MIPFPTSWTFSHKVSWVFLYVFLEESISAYTKYLMCFVKNFRMFALHTDVFFRELIYLIFSETFQ